MLITFIMTSILMGTIGIIAAGLSADEISFKSTPNINILPLIMRDHLRD